MNDEIQEAKRVALESAERKAKKDELFFHHIPSRDECDHDFRGFRAFPDGNGGEQVCSKCGIGAMAYTLRYGP